MIKEKFFGFFMMAQLFAVSVQAQNFEWVRQVGGPGKDEARSVAVDAVGNVYTTGSFAGTVDFDPGEGVFNLTARPQVEDIFIQKLDATGKLVWARQLEGLVNCKGLAITVDVAERVYVTGHFRATVDFDPGPGIANLTSVSAGDSDAFILKLNAAGNYEWAKQISATKTVEGKAIVVDVDGNVYTTGEYNGDADFDPGLGTLFLHSLAQDAYIQKLDSSGNLIWAKQFGAMSIGSSIAVDADQNVYMTGYFVWGPSKGGADIYLIKYNRQGNGIWVKQMGGGRR